MENYTILYKCNRCLQVFGKKTLYCGHCGAKWYNKEIKGE